jgi:aspartyl-tRNA(Asn)/glutamyl-tRNA(Gln) amidotransferase subunit A
MADWRGLSAAELGRRIDAGAVDPVDLAEAFLDAIAVHPEAARIYARVCPDRARTEARGAADRARAGQRRHALDGVPLSWKDNVDTAGIATEGGSALLAGRRPEADADVLATATHQGAVCLGKTHLSELAFSGLGLNPVTASAPNVNDPAAVPGGSSSGAAASVAFGLAPAAIGSDTGGSVRIPAAWNDLVGLKTTFGRVSGRGIVPLAESFDTVGPLTRTVEDAALALSLIEGTKPADLAGASLSGVRLLVLETAAFDGIREAPAAAFDAAARRIEAAGATLVRAAVPPVAAALDLSAILFSTEAYAIWRETIEAAPDRMFPPILERFRGGAGFAGADYVAAWRRLRTLRGAYAEATAGYDAVILPTAPNLPPDAARLMADGDYYVSENLLTLRNTRIGNLLGLCALTLPTGAPSCGLMLMAAPFAEERLLRLGAAAERALRA